ncbi:hypothetical protein [Pseudomonas protegens]|uniref:hypothetical protein n=1 Tax=Pseudomonas protegens TaxID=380021 RepID=UPI001E3EE604|nr:hypothetical protein [Pseudomonas protegens]MCD9568762.1 hypothetical protein [Pseudomonas protegens]
MSIINKIVISESPRDVILFLAKGEAGISYPKLDRIYNINNWINISNNLELLKLVELMKQEGLIKEAGGGLVKGPAWKEPGFITEKKYSFE